MSSLIRIIDEGEDGGIILVANRAYFITEDEENGLLLTDATGAIDIDDEGRIFYTTPYDATFYGRADSRSRVKSGER